MHNTAAHRRRQQAIAVGKERRESLIRAKRLCRDSVIDGSESPFEGDMIIDEEKEALDSKTSQTVLELKSAIAFQYSLSLSLLYSKLHIQL